MRSADALDRLDRYQAAILATCADALPLLDGDPQQVRANLSRARWTLARQLREYQVFKHTEIFEPMIRSGDPARVMRAQAMSERCIANGQAITAHVKRWSGCDVASQWNVYRPALQTLTRRVRQAIMEERSGVLALLSGCEQTRRRA